ncbi:hypothetical protein GCM10017556_25790 [Micromonospora sagamiensis]|nr:hypothetical protein GCM10017556_25790 [Micromonospora sagamiensis]
MSGPGPPGGETLARATVARPAIPPTAAPPTAAEPTEARPLEPPTEARPAEAGLTGRAEPTEARPLEPFPTEARPAGAPPAAGGTGTDARPEPARPTEAEPDGGGLIGGAMPGRGTEAPPRATEAEPDTEARPLDPAARGVGVARPLGVAPSCPEDHPVPRLSAPGRRYASSAPGPGSPSEPGIRARPCGELGSPYEFILHTLPVAVGREHATTGLP